jgi:hypothetical protein
MYGAAASRPTPADPLIDAADESTSASSATNIDLSDEAKAYLAKSAADEKTPVDSLATVASDARSWFDQQYKTLGISSAQIDGQTAVDFSGQSRATLSAVASNAEGLFSKDESTAATTALQSRFDDTIAPYAVIARHTGDYGGLYDAAANYLDGAGADERATSTWQDQRQALTTGSAVAHKNFGKAPDTGNSNDLVRAYLNKSTAPASSAAGATTSDIASRARALLDDQINSARDNGKELTFSSTSKTGQAADFSAFDNRTLASVVLNQDSTFSPTEANAAKAELNQRTRASLLEALNSGNGSDVRTSSLAMIRQYTNMSSEEKSVLGVTDQVLNRLAQTYQKVTTLQNTFSQNAGLSAYF